MPYFLRFTNDPTGDLERGTSIHASDFASIEEAESYYPDKNWVKTEAGIIGEVLNGLCGYMLESTNIDDAIKEARLNNYQFSFVGDAYIYEGKYIDNAFDGDVFEPIRVVCKI